ncbi:helix-hairpin-helix domain-containing protein, partial [Enterococcus faecium]|uniref:helix-hairpin-helix domain-containing protein n=1 Tax=Enterococcus faecium TaxID=1352 RepID=UPI003CC52A00
MDQVIMGLNRYGIGRQFAYSIYEAYKNESLDIIEENPYQLVEDLEGIGFKRADNLAEQIGIAADSPRSIRAGILLLIFVHADHTGDTYVS